jgi:hypothetical protein
MKANKYAYLFVLQGFYAHGWEDLCATDKSERGAWKEIVTHKREYRDNEGGQYRIIERRELNTNTQEAT